MNGSITSPARRGEAPSGSGEPLRRLDPAAAPYRVAEIELSAPGAAGPVVTVPGAPRGTAVRGRVLALVRMHGAPLGTVLADIAESQRAADVLAEAASRDLAKAVQAHRALDESEDVGARDRSAGASAFAAGPPPPCRQRRADALARRRMISVVVATRERPRQLARCLDSLVRQRYPRFEVIVVDNAPATDETRRLVGDRFFGDVTYVSEPRRGLANAHNRGLAVARGQIVAFTDDDVIADEDWLAAMAEGFDAADGIVGCVTGLIVPAELDTPAQVMVEAQGGFGKGYAPTYRSLRQPAGDTLFPFAAGRLGSGANMAFSTELLRRLGGFDPATGTGTAARGGDDLLAFFRIAAAGFGIVYQPSAIVWHHHHRDVEDLEKQAFGYGVGLGAYLTAAVVREPRMIPALLRRLPPGIAYAVAQWRSGALAARLHAQPRMPRIATARHRGLIRGPFAYARSRWQSGRTEPRR